jgi:hypothetical protein
MRAADYTTVIPQGSPNYLSPSEPSCPPTRRYMVVHRVSGGGWGIVDRRTGRLVADPQYAPERHVSWGDMQAAVRTLHAVATG